MLTLQKCPTSAELRALSLGQLSDEQSDEMLGHLQNCETCQEQLATADPLDDTLVGHLRGTSPESQFADEKECQIALAKALSTLANADLHSLDQSELSDLLPSVLGEYEIVRPIGRGGMGNVYLARHSKLGRLVALKVLSSHRLLQPRMRQRFETEMRAVGGLSHPNIVTAHDAREVDQLAVLVTEYIDGLDVGQILRRTGKLSVSDACEIARQIALALEYVDEQGLVHRDIKPSNVMIGRGGEVKLLDLGLARLQLGDDDRPEMTATGQAMGTADYIAPEQVNDSRHVDIRADIYALGCTLFKMLSGQPPFDDERYPTSFAKMTAHVADAPPALQSLAPETPLHLAKLVDQMIAKDASKRPQSPREVAELLAKFIDRADLKQLVEQAIEAGELVDEPTRKTTSKPLTLQPKPQPIFRRRVPLLVAIGCGIFGMLIGFALGVIITIKHPDGKVTQVEIPNGAKAKVSEDGNVEINLPGEQKQAMDQQAGSEMLRQMMAKMETNAMDETIGERVMREMMRKGQRATQERLQGVWEPTWRNVGGEALPNPWTQLVAFVENKQIVVMGQNVLSLGSFKIDNSGEYSVFDYEFSDFPKKAVIKFIDNDKFTMESEITAIGTYNRISQLPLTTDKLVMIQNNPKTANLLGSVKIIAHYEKTGEVPITKEAATRREAAMKAHSQNDLKQLALALHNFHDVNRTFPAAINVKRDDAETKPYSWRVAILPYMGEEELYNQYRFDEDWDSEDNLKVLKKMPAAFRDPQAKEDATETPYLALIGPETVIGDEPVQIRDILDGTSNTIMLVETKKMVPWTKPEDIAYSAEVMLPELKPVYEDGFQTVLANGSVYLVPKDTDEKTWRAMTTRKGGEPTLIPGPANR